MNNTLLRIKIEQRLNKLSTQDYSNIKPWMVIEAFNKAQVEWVRRNLHGGNQYKEGDEQSVRRVDDLQILLTPHSFVLTAGKVFTEAPIPTDYLQYKRITIHAKRDCCKEVRRMRTYLVEEAMVDTYLEDFNSKPSFEWGETFATLIGNTARLYHNDDFIVSKAQLTYYRFPQDIQILGVVNPNTGIASTVEIESELKDDLVEVIVDDAAAILAGDIESFNQYTRENQNAEKNN
jgi:hypothetical protein